MRSNNSLANLKSSLDRFIADGAYVVAEYEGFKIQFG